MELADKELITEFVIESQEGLANVETQMLAVEAAGENVEPDLVNAVFRTMHSIKGAAGFLGLDRIGTLAHGLEEVLDDLRNREVMPTSELVSTILRAADFMKGLIDAVESSNDADVTPYVADLQKLRPGAEEAVPAPAAATTPEPGAAEPVAAGEPNAAAPTGKSSGPAAKKRGKQPKGSTKKAAKSAPADANEPDESTPQSPKTAQLSDTVREFLVECSENLEQMERDLMALESDPTSVPLLRSVFRTMHTVKGGAGFLGLGALEQLAHAAENVLGQLRDGQRPMTPDVVAAMFNAVDLCRKGLQKVEAGADFVNEDAQPVIQQLLALDCAAAKSHDGSDASATSAAAEAAVAAPAPANLSSAPSADQVIPKTLPEAAARKPSAAPDPESPSGERSHAAPTGDTTIRVDVALLDKLMTRVGELVLARNQILQHTNGLDDAAFVSAAQRLDLITTELQEGVMKTRMQPIGNVWTKFPRVVRDLSNQLGKRVRIEMEGKETELDKTIVEAIKDPLTHLVRNSIDHGIEKPDVRKAAGKPEEGLLFLRAFHEGGQVIIEIVDDGAGLNIDRIKKKAIERGIVTAEHASRMSDREAAQLILLPGFSTAEQVTSVSGRGVGMDVVKTNIERIGGMLDLQSQPGQGTTIRIKIPLTLAIIPALVVANGGDRYAIPQVSLLELVRLEGEQVRKQIEFVHGAPVYRLRGKLLPLVDLSERLGQTPSRALTFRGTEQGTDDLIVNIVVLRANDRQFGLVVDKVNDSEEIVVKPLSRQLKGLREYAGATIMGDGTVALILDVMGLAVSAGLAGELRDQGHAGAHASDARSGRETHTLLVVDLGDERRFALPTSLVSRLERVPRTAIESADGREVIQYRGDIMPLVRISDVVGGSPHTTEAPAEIQIVVYTDHDYACGFVVGRIVDIVETELNFQRESQGNENLLGTTVIQQRVTDVLNLRTLARHGAPTSIAS